MDLIDRYTGSLLGLAVGDSLGAPIEFKAPGSFKTLGDFIGGGTWGLKAGYWTDDTSMALCLAESLITRKFFDPYDQLVRYLRWFREGHLSSTDKCFDIGGTTRKSLMRFEEQGSLYANPGDDYEAGNGSLMRLAPVPLFFVSDTASAIEYSGLSSLTTHGALAARDACRLHGSLIVGALLGASKDEILRNSYAPIANYWKKAPLTPEIREISEGSYKRREPPIIKADSYVVKTLEAAIWAFYKTNSFEEGVLLAVNLGDDSDTVGAVYGQLAGAYYGECQIPDSWLEALAHRPLIESFGERLFELAT
jgi:ADP-ribosylglycohydrolase